VPVFALTGQEGKLFRPLAFTKTFSMDGGHAPVRHSGAGAVQPHHRRPHPRRGIEPDHAPLMWLYRPILGWVLRHRVATLAAAVLVFVGAVAVIPRIGRNSCRR
jgi:Cu(I)/Ag(I) efflux system membrane protein CusA/SilA